MKKLKIDKIEIDDAVLLAPMEGVTDLPFRIICRDMGADIVYSEFIASEALIRNAEKSMQKMRIVEHERPVAIQIFGSRLEAMTESAKIVEDAGADILDINYGCWVKKVVNHDAGAAFLKDPERMAEYTHAVSEAVSIPVTIKTRLGWDKNSIAILKAAELLKQTGCKMLAVHCRTRDMGMRGHADWSWLPKIKEAAGNLPVILNGDITTPIEAKKAFDTTNCDGIMIGRAAVGNPFLFKAIKKYFDTGEIYEPTLREKIDTCIQHLQMNIIYKGYPRGLYEFRKHYSGYLKGYYNASNLRQKLVITESYDEAAELLENYYSNMEAEGRLDREDNMHHVNELACPAEEQE